MFIAFKFGIFWAKPEAILRQSVSQMFAILNPKRKSIFYLTCTVRCKTKDNFEGSTVAKKLQLPNPKVEILIFIHYKKFAKIHVEEPLSQNFPTLNPKLNYRIFIESKNWKQKI